jgi:hypothetical protein
MAKRSFKAPVAGATRRLALGLLCGGALLLGGAAASSAEDLHWYRGSTHVHDIYVHAPDGNTPLTAAKWYAAHGYDFIVQTEHELVIDPRQLVPPEKFLIIPGEEISQAIYDPSAPLAGRFPHVIALGLKTTIMPLQNEDLKDVSKLTARQIFAATAARISVADSYKRNFDLIRQQGAIAQVNHPNGQWTARPQDLMGLEGPYLLEVWNAAAFINNLGGVNDKGEITPSTEEMWDDLLTAGRVVWGVGSDDAHDYQHFDNPLATTPGKAWIVVRAAALEQDAILASIRKGDFYFSTGVSLKSVSFTGDTLALTLGPPPGFQDDNAPAQSFKIAFIGKGGRVLQVIAKASGGSASFTAGPDEPYVRAVITDSDGRRAWTQPVFLDDRRKLSPYRED